MESVWYYARGGAQTGPVSFGDLKAAIASGQLSADDLVWREGTADWVAARTVAGLFPPAPTAPPPPAAVPSPPPPRMPAPAVLSPRLPTRAPAEALPLADEATPAPPPVAQSSEIIEMAKLFVRRAAAANPSTIAATVGEDRLLSQGGYEPVTRKFAVWRRAMLWVSVVPTAFAGLFGLISILDMETDEKAMLSPFGTLLLFLQVFALCAVPFVAVFAALAYDRLAKSARLVLIGGLVTVAVPLLVAFAPGRWQVDPKTTPSETVESVELRKMVYLSGLGYKHFLLVMPIVLAVVPAVSRACIRVKGFLPESLVPGWALVASSPIMVFLALSSFIVIYHAASSATLLLGLLLLIGAPLLYLTRFRLLTRPITESQDLAALAKSHLYVLAASVTGIVVILIYLMSAQQAGHKLLGTNKDAVWRIWSVSFHKTWLEYVGRSLFLTVFFADLLVRMAVMAWREERAFAGTGTSASFDQTMSAMGEAVEVPGNPPVA